MPSHVARFGSASPGDGERRIPRERRRHRLRHKSGSKLETCQALAIRPEGMVERAAPFARFRNHKSLSRKTPRPRRQPRRLSTDVLAGDHECACPEKTPKIPPQRTSSFPKSTSGFAKRPKWSRKRLMVLAKGLVVFAKGRVVFAKTTGRFHKTTNGFHKRTNGFGKRLMVPPKVPVISLTWD